LAAQLPGVVKGMVPLRIGEAARDELGWPLHVIDSSGHAPHIEPTQAFLAALAEIEAS
jgi:pimeloyl-ACP methyl ester carboxylesterase